MTVEVKIVTTQGDLSIEKMARVIFEDAEWGNAETCTARIIGIVKGLTHDEVLK